MILENLPMLLLLFVFLLFFFFPPHSSLSFPSPLPLIPPFPFLPFPCSCLFFSFFSFPSSLLIPPPTPYFSLSPLLTPPFPSLPLSILHPPSSSSFPPCYFSLSFRFSPLTLPPLPPPLHFPLLHIPSPFFFPFNCPSSSLLLAELFQFHMYCPYSLSSSFLPPICLPFSLLC